MYFLLNFQENTNFLRYSQLFEPSGKEGCSKPPGNVEDRRILAAPEKSQFILSLIRFYVKMSG